MLGCCISAFVSINRFGFALDGALCSFDRIYYDFKNGELKIPEPKWTGFVALRKILDDIDTVYNTEINTVILEYFKLTALSLFILPIIEEAS